MKLEKIVTIKGTLRCMSGLHIGGGDTEMHIGGIDNAVIRHPLTQRPYIPGSSLKGKMRSLLEWRSGAVKAAPLGWSDYQNAANPEAVMPILKLFGAGGNNANMPTSTLTDADFENGNINVLSMLVATGLCPSRGEARRLVQQGGVTIDDVKVASIDESLARERFEGEGIIVRKGKKVFHRVKA